MEPPPELNPQFYTEPEDRVRRRSTGSEAQLLHQQSQNVEASKFSTSSMQSNLTKLVWDASQQQMRRVFSLYANIDLFRPYFDVKPKRVRNYLILSLIPQKPSSMQKLQHDLYGPLMILFTLVALLLYSMKAAKITVEDGTLIGAAFVTCFGYWFFVSSAVYTMSYIFSSAVTLVQTFSMLGYALFSHCLILALTLFIHAFSDSHAVFYVLLIVFGGLSSLRLAIFFISKTPSRSHKLFIGGIVTFLHICFMLYIHFGYHQVVEEIAEILGDNEMPSVEKPTAKIQIA